MLTGAAIAAVSFAEAKTAYVSSGGDDTTGVVDNPDLPFATLKTALTKLTTGDVLQLKDGTHFLNGEQFTLGKAVTLRGNPADRRKAVIDIGRTAENGGFGIYISASGACVRDLTVSNAYLNTVNYGAGISCLVRAAITNCVFTHCTSYNTATSGGGALCLRQGGEAYGCEFLNNYAYYRGGAVFLDDYESKVIKCDFHDNESHGSGGALFGFAGQVIDCTFTDNLGNGGGAVSLNDGMISGSTFVGNSTPGGSSGGAVAGKYEHGIFDCVFKNNSCTSHGGAIVLNVSNCTNYLYGCVFSNNVCLAMGSAVAVTQAGGGLYAEGCKFLYNSETNTAPGWCAGGAVAMAEKKESQWSFIDRCEFIGNSGNAHAGFNAYYCGGLLPGSEIRNSLFYGNVCKIRAPADGAAIAVARPLTICNCTIVSNRAMSGTSPAVFTASATEPTEVKVVNTVMAQNIGKNDAQCDIDPDATKNGRVVTDHCVSETTLPAGTGNRVMTVSEMGFTDAANGDYTLAKDSVLINEGLNFNWMVGASDIRGNARKFPRIRKDGVNIVDIGCYEYRPTLGLMLLLR